MENLLLYEGKCYTTCPERSYILPEPLKTRLRSAGRDTSRSLRDIHQAIADKRAILKSTPQKQCASCHFSCLKCQGPSDYDCTSCAPDSILNKRSNTEAYCMTKVSVVETSQNALYEEHGKRLIVPIIAGVLTSIGLISAIVWSVLRLTGKRKEHEYIYDRIAFVSSNDNDTVIIDQDVLDDSSESDMD